MKAKNIRLIILVSMIVLLVLAAIGYLNGAVYSTFLAFPFQQIIMLVSFLSTKGVILNGIGIFVYLAVTLLPFVYLVDKVLKGRANVEDLLLILLSITIGYSLYVGLNPVSEHIQIDSKEFVIERYTVISMVNYWILISYLAIKLIRNVEKIDSNNSILYIQYLLAFVSLVIIVNIIGVELPNYIMQSKAMGDPNGNGRNIAFVFLSFLTRMVPSLLAVILIFRSFELNRKNIEVRIVRFAQRIKKLSRLFLMISFGVIGVHSFISVFFIDYVASKNMISMAQLASLIVIFAFYIISNTILKNKELEEESRLIV